MRDPEPTKPGRLDVGVVGAGRVGAVVGAALRAAGHDIEKLLAGEAPAPSEILDSAKTWRDLWSAGHGVTLIDDVPTTAELVERLEAEYRAATSL